MRKYRCFLVLFILLQTLALHAANEVHVMAVTIESAKLAEKTAFVRHLDGKKETISFTKDTPITSLAEAAISKSLHGGAGYQFIVHYSIKGGMKIANRFDFVGREEWKTFQGNLQKREVTQRNVVVMGEDGMAVTFLAGKYCSVEISSGAKSFVEWTSSNTDSPERIIVRFTEVKGQKMVHLIEVVPQD